MNDAGGANGAYGAGGAVPVGVAVERPSLPAPGGVTAGSALPPPVKVIEVYPPEPDELPPPTFRQALIGYGSILLGLVLLGVLLGGLMRLLR